MFPFASRWRWWSSPGYLHLVEAIESHIDEFEDPFRKVLRNRARRIRIALNVRLVVLVLLNIGLVATGLAWAARVLPGLAEAQGWLTTLAGSLTGISVVLTLVFLLVSRYLGQLQADVVASMVLGTPGGPYIGEEEREAVAALEDESPRQGENPDEEPDEDRREA